MPEAVKPKLTRTLIYEIALPDFYAEDLDPADEVLIEMYGTTEGQQQLTDEEMFDAITESSGMITGGHVRVMILTGSEAGNLLQVVDGFLVGGRVVPRVPDHEREKDDRLDDAEADYVQFEARRRSAA